MLMAANRPEATWLGLVAGNSRLHWAAFADQRWLGTWHTPHLKAEQARILAAAQFAPESWEGIAAPGSLPPLTAPPESLWLASVVSAQLQLWQGYDWMRRVELNHLPLENLYHTLGIDRALALLGAGTTYGWPVLVIDGGTALTLTAGDSHKPAPKGDRYPSSQTGRFTGGAILPGLALQVSALTAQTDALPEIPWPDQLPCRWAHTTVEAIQSGILHTVIGGLQAYLTDWRQQHPEGHVLLTGGDRDRLMTYLTSSQQNSEEADMAAPFTHQQKNDSNVRDIRVDENLAFWGLRSYRNQLKYR